MMSLTHAALAVCSTAVVLNTADPYVLLTAGLASQLPDIDTSESFTGRLVWPLTRWIEERYPHRTLTHSFAATGVAAALAVGTVFYAGWPWLFAIAFTLGYFMGWFSDAFTKSGVAAFWPSEARLVIPGNPRARLSTHSPQEYWVLGLAVLLTVASVNITSAGGISETVAKAFFNDPATAADLFNKYGAEQRVLVEVEGLHVPTSQAVTGRYEVLEATNSDLVAEDVLTKRLYKIGRSPDVQIRATRIKAEVSDPVAITSQTLTLLETDALSWVTTLPQNAYLSGTLFLDDAGDLQIPNSLETYPTLRLSGGQLELSKARPTEVAALLQVYWILGGQVIVKVRA